MRQRVQPVVEEAISPGEPGDDQWAEVMSAAALVQLSMVAHVMLVLGYVSITTPGL